MAVTRIRRGAASGAGVGLGSAAVRTVYEPVEYELVEVLEQPVARL